MAIYLPIIISLVGVVLSIISASFISGAKWGSITATINTISERLARIEGMFELKIKRDE